jgi:hypothetical protein
VVKRTVVAASVAVVLALPADLPACGDKFLVPGRGARFRNRVVDRESATVLLYARPGSALARALGTLSVEARLRAAGYRPTVARSREELESALRGGGWDVVVVDLADASDVGWLQTAPAPLVLPVVQEVPKAVVDDAKRRYSLVLRSPRRYQTFLEALDKLISARARGRARPVASAGA